MQKLLKSFFLDSALIALYILPLYTAIFGVGLMVLLINKQFSDLLIGLWAVLLLILVVGFSRHFRIKFKNVSKPATAVTFIGVVLIGGWLLWNVNYTAQHVYSDRDPGTYLLTAAYLQDSKDLTYDIPQEVQNIPRTTTESPGFTYLDNEKTELSGQGMHMLSALAAVFGKVFGELRMSSANVVFGSLALLAFFGFSRLVMEEKWALLGTAIFALSLPFMYFSRDMYTEPLAMMCLFSGLSLFYFASKTNSLNHWFLGALAIGAMTLVRIDGFMSIGVVMFMLLVQLATRDRQEFHYYNRVAFTVVLTLIAVSAIGLTDLFVFTPNYFTGANRDELIIYQFYLVFALLAAGLCLVGISQRFEIKRLLDEKKIRSLFIGLAGLVFVVVLSRPLWLMTHSASPNSFVAGIQTVLEHALEPTRSYNELSAEWLTWYYGAPIVYVGVGYAVWYATRHLANTKRFAIVLLMTITLVNASVYIIRPSVSPDQVWAIRRFLPIVIPGLLLVAMLAAQGFGDYIGKHIRRSHYFVFTALILLITVMNVSRPFWFKGEYQRMRGFSTMCINIPENAVVLWISQAGNELVMGTNIYCDKPSAAFVSSFPTKKILAQTAQEVNRRGKDLIVGYYASHSNKLEHKVKQDQSSFVVDYDYYEFERGLFGPPKSATTKEQTIYFAEVAESGEFREVKLPGKEQ